MQPVAVYWIVMEVVTGPLGWWVQGTVLSLGTADVEGSLGADTRAAFAYVKKGHEGGLPFIGTELGSVGGNQGAPFPA